MTEQQIKNRLSHHRNQLRGIANAYEWRLIRIEQCKIQLKKLDDLVIFCKTGKYPE